MFQTTSNDLHLHVRNLVVWLYWEICFMDTGLRVYFVVKILQFLNLVWRHGQFILTSQRLDMDAHMFFGYTCNMRNHT